MLDVVKVGAAVILHGNKVLITRRAPQENFAGGWEFPGGKVEFGESFEECIVREVREELKFNIRVKEFCAESLYDYGSINIRMRAYYCCVVDGSPELSVHDKLKWVVINDLSSYNLLPADIPIAKKIMEDFCDE